MLWEGTAVVVFERLEGVLEVFLKDTRADDLLALLALRTRLGVVLAHVLVVSSAETNNTLFALVANINTNKHGLIGDFWSVIEAPKITTKLSVDLSEDVNVDSVVILLENLSGDELRNDWAVSVDLVLEGGVKMLSFDRVWHNDQEEELVLRFLWFLELSALGIFAADVGAIVVFDSIFKCLNTRFVAELNDITVVNINVETSLL